MRGTLPTRTEPPVARGDHVAVEGMPSYGELLVTSVKWSFVSGWWIEVMDEVGSTWSVHSSTVVTA